MQTKHLVLKCVTNSRNPCILSAIYAGQHTLHRSLPIEAFWGTVISALQTNGSGRNMETAKISIGQLSGRDAFAECVDFLS
jgi:hypothetical protein